MIKKTIIALSIISMVIISCDKPTTNPENKEIWHFAGQYEGAKYFPYPNVLISKTKTIVYINSSESLVIDNKYIKNDHYNSIYNVALYSFKYTNDNSIYYGEIDIKATETSLSLTMAVNKDYQILIPIFSVSGYYKTSTPIHSISKE